MDTAEYQWTIPPLYLITINDTRPNCTPRINMILVRYGLWMLLIHLMDVQSGPRFSLVRSSFVLFNNYILSYASLDALVFRCTGVMPRNEPLGSISCLTPGLQLDGENWPVGGEIDIFESINLRTRNQYALHVESQSYVPYPSSIFPFLHPIPIFGPLRCLGSVLTDHDQTDNRCTAQSVNQLGNTTATTCGTTATDTTGCTVNSASDVSYGVGFANAGGGVYVCEFASDGIRIWFFAVCPFFFFFLLWPPCISYFSPFYFFSHSLFIFILRSSPKSMEWLMVRGVMFPLQ